MKPAMLFAGIPMFLGACGYGNGSRHEDSTLAAEVQNVRSSSCSPIAPIPFRLNQQDSSYHRENAYWATWFSQTIESPEELMQQRLKDLPIEETAFVRRAPSGIQAGIFRIGNAVVVVSRGTADMDDMLANVLVETKDGDRYGLPGKVHGGFADNFLDLWPEISAAATRLGAGRLGVWVFGHSLGGAISTFAAYSFAKRGITVHGVYTSGTPLGGNGAFQAGYEALLPRKTYMVGYESDITPNVPPVPEAAQSFEQAVDPDFRPMVRDLVPQLGYRPVGRQFLLKQGGELVELTDMAAHQKRYYDTLRVENPGKFLPYLLKGSAKYIAHHDTEHYRCALRSGL
jgi:hypothetical protein